MRFYALPEPTPLERDILAARSASERGAVRWKTFPNGELLAHVDGPGAEACVLGRTAPPSDDLVRTLLLIDALRRQGCARLAVAVPHFGYARQDRPVLPGDSCAGPMLAALLAHAGATRILTVDLHSDAVAEAGPVRVENLSPVTDMVLELQRALDGKDCTVVAPDFGARGRAEALASALGLREPAWVEKRRDPATGQVSLVDVHGSLRGDVAVIVDDILDTGGTIELAAKALRGKGFSTIILCVTHPLFSKGAAARLRRSRLAKIVTTDTVPLGRDAARLPGMTVVSVAARIEAALRAGEKE